MGMDMVCIPGDSLEKAMPANTGRCIMCGRGLVFGGIQGSGGWVVPKVCNCHTFRAQPGGSPRKPQNRPVFKRKTVVLE